MLFFHFSSNLNRTNILQANSGDLLCLHMSNKKDARLIWVENREHKEIYILFLMEGVHIWHSDCLWCVDDYKCSHYKYDLGVKGQGQINLNSVLSLVMPTPLPVYNEMCSYLAQQLLNVSMITKVSNHQI